MGAKCSTACDDSGRRNIGYAFFEIVGTGGFSKVWRVQKDGTTTNNALKQMVKFKIMSKNSVEAILNERLILQDLDHPFIINLISAFQDKYNLYLIMDYLPGGDLRFHLRMNKAYTEAQAKFIIACILISVEYIHSKEIIHRDIKPENLIFDSEGYLRLTDFGISRYLKLDNSGETSGTPGYLAPETLMRQSHGKASDFFAIGVILYELLKGVRPYNVRTRKQMRDMILAKEVQLVEEAEVGVMSKECVNMINSLLKIKSGKRLGNKNIQEVYDHPWFKGYDIDAIRKKKSKHVFFLPKEGVSYNRKPRLETETSDADLKNKELLNKNEYQFPTKKEEATRDQGNLSSTFNDIHDQSSSSAGAAGAAGAAGGYVPLEEVAEVEEKHDDKQNDQSSERLIKKPSVVEKGDKKVDDKPSEKGVEQQQQLKSVDPTIEKTTEKYSEIQVQKSIDKTNLKSMEKTIDQTHDKNGEISIQQSAEKPVLKMSERLGDKIVIQKSVDNTVDQQKKQEKIQNKIIEEAS